MPSQKDREKKKKENDKKKTQSEEAKENLPSLEERILGPDYNYSAQIKSPQALGMSAHGSFGALTDDIGGLLSYIGLLVTGRSDASVTGQPLGTRFFLPTDAECTDVATKEIVSRSLYVNNIPDGTLPFISQAMGGSGFTDFEGLLPGVLSNLNNIHPLQILTAITNGSSPPCQKITMPTMDKNNVPGMASGYVLNNDIASMNPSWFPSGQRPPITEQFNTMHNSKLSDENNNLFNTSTLQGSKINYSKMPNNLLVKIYFTSLGLLGLYIFFKMMRKKKVY